MTEKKANVFGGMFMQRNLVTGEWRKSEPGPPQRVICRRLRDFPNGMPDGAAITSCVECGCAVVTELVFATTPRICMQCSDIEPLPFPQESA